MSKLRILYDIASDRASLTASTTAGNLVVDNLKSNHKSLVWRSTSTTASLTATWTTPEFVGCIAIPFCNFTSTATIRARGYSDTEGTQLVFDTGFVLACPYSPLGAFKWGQEPLGLNSYSYGGGTYASVWTPIKTAMKVVIDLVDDGNPYGYLDCGRLVLGGYWSPVYNPQYGATATTQDTTKQYRTEAGELLSDIGTVSKRISINLSVMLPSDRSAFWRVTRSAGMSKPIFLSVFPENLDSELEQTHQIFGKIPTFGGISASSYNLYSAPLEIEEI